MKATKLTQEQALIITGFTGITSTKFSDFHGDVEKRLGRPVWTHQFADPAVWEEIKQAYKEDFMAILPESAIKPEKTDERNVNQQLTRPGA